MLRACVDRGNKQLKTEAKPQDVTVIDCMEDWAQAPIHQRLFFNLYQHPSKVPDSLKLYWAVCWRVALDHLLVCVGISKLSK